MKWITPASRYFLLSLNSLLLFLSFFSGHLIIPGSLQIAGRFHPLILHLPIGLLCITILIYFLRKKFIEEPADVISLLLHAGALSAVISALLGIFLSKEGGYDESLLGNHQWAGVGISILSAVLAWTYKPGPPSPLVQAIMVMLIPVLILGSHFGASLTHGEDYLSIAKEEKKTVKVITDSSAIFDAVVEPVLQTKCYSCHNEKKAKGQLIMTSIKTLLEGGKNGKIWVPGDPLNSHIMQRVALDEDNKKHMPPRGKPQLTEREINLMSEWIKNGADIKTRFSDLPPSDSFRIFAASFIPRNENVKSYAFPAASDALVEKYQSPYLTIQALATGSPALRADFFIRQEFSSSRIKDLEKMALQIVELNLSNMPVKDADLAMISKFTNMEWLNLNGSMVTGKGFEQLQQCKKLSVISLAATPVTKEALNLLGGMKNIKKIYCWNTRAGMADIKELSARFKDIQWDNGFKPDSSERLQLTPPLLKNDDIRVLGKNDSVALKHPMPGVTIRFTTDGKDPDSMQSPVYSKSFAIDKTTQVKAIAVRPGWNASAITAITFFSKGTIPSFSRLLSQPDKQYLASGIQTLTDGQKGETSNLKSSWLGFRDTHFDGIFYFNKDQYIHEVVISAAKNIGAFVMPPQKIEVWAGKDSVNMKHIKTIIPEQPSKYIPDKIEAHKAEVNGRFGCIRLIIYPVKKLPLWHAGKGQKAWIFLDEVFFN